MFVNFFSLLIILHAGSAGVEAPTWSDWLISWGPVVVAILLVCASLVCWAANLVALPGNWVCVALLALYVWLGPEVGRAAVSGTTLVFTFVLALVGEVVEFLAAAMGAQRAGASRRATALAMVGSIVGALVGAVVGLPVPVIGSVLAAVLFGGLGATAGAMYGHRTDGKAWRETWAIGHAAFWGRTFGTLGKLLAGLGIVIVIIAAVLVR